MANFPFGFGTFYGSAWTLFLIDFSPTQSRLWSLESVLMSWGKCLARVLNLLQSIKPYQKLGFNRATSFACQASLGNFDSGWRWGQDTIQLNILFPFFSIPAFCWIPQLWIPHLNPVFFPHVIDPAYQYLNPSTLWQAFLHKNDVFWKRGNGIPAFSLASLGATKFKNGFCIVNFVLKVKKSVISIS